jgi:hypothetical protein
MEAGVVKLSLPASESEGEGGGVVKLNLPTSEKEIDGGRGGEAEPPSK